MTVSNVRHISSAEIDRMEPNIAMRLVQNQRYHLLSDAIKDMAKDMQQRNESVSTLNASLVSARDLLAQFGEKDGAGKTITELIDDQKKSMRKDQDSQWFKDNLVHREDQETAKKTGINEQNSIISKAKEEQVRLLAEGKKNGKSEKEIKNSPAWSYQNQVMQDAENEKTAINKTKIVDLDLPDNMTKAGALLEKLTASADIAKLDFSVGKKSELQTLVENIKTMTDTAGTTQQSEMLRMQSYIGEFNQSVEGQSNTIKGAQGVSKHIANNS